MKAEVKRLHSPDVDDLATWTPDSSEFAILLQIFAAPEDSLGEESFDVTICSPSWLARRAKEEYIVDARHHLVVIDYDYSRIATYVSNYVLRCDGSTWAEVAGKLSRLGRWEFEDYTA